MLQRLPAAILGKNLHLVLISFVEKVVPAQQDGKGSVVEQDLILCLDPGKVKLPGLILGEMNLQFVRLKFPEHLLPGTRPSSASRLFPIGALGQLALDLGTQGDALALLIVNNLPCAHRPLQFFVVKMHRLRRVPEEAQLPYRRRPGGLLAAHLKALAANHQRAPFGGMRCQRPDRPQIPQHSCAAIFC